MAALDLVLRRSSRIASPKRRHELEQDRDLDNDNDSDQLTPRALRALKRQRLNLDPDGLPLPQLEPHQRRRKRKENDNFPSPGPLKEVRRRVRHLRIRTRPQNLSKSRHIVSSQPIPPSIQSAVLAPNVDDTKNQDAPAQIPPPRSPSPIPHHRSPSPVLTPPHSPPSLPRSAHVTVEPPADVIQSQSQSPPPSSSSHPPSQSPPLNPLTHAQSNTHPSPSLQVDLDSLIPLDPMPEFLPHDPPYTDSSTFPSNTSFNSEQVFPSGGDMNFSSNPSFSSPQESTFSPPGAFESNNAFTSNTGSFSNTFGPHSHEFIPVQSHSHSELSTPQDNTFSDTTAFPSPGDFPTSSSNGFASPPSNGFHPQSNDYAQSNSYPQSNGYTQQGSFSQQNHLLHTCDYTPVPHRDREVNIWKLACQERVELLLRRYGIDTIKALVASQARARYQSSPPDVFFSNHASNTRFRLYTPASYTYKSAEFESVDFDMDEDADYDEDDDEDEDEECDYTCEYDYHNEGDGNGDELFPMDVEKEVSGEVVVDRCSDRDMLRHPESPEIKTKINTPIPIVPPTVPPIPQTLPISSSENSIPIPIPQIPESTSVSSADSVRSSPGVMRSPRTVSIPHILPSRPLCTPHPSSTHETATPASASSMHQASTATGPMPSSQTANVLPQTPLPSTHQAPQTPPAPTLLRTPPLSSLHVTILSEPPRAFMGRGTPPDRRRLIEWGRFGCVHTHFRAMGLREDIEFTHTSLSVPRGEHTSPSRGEYEPTPQGEHVPVSHGENTSAPLGEHVPMSVPHGETQHGEPPPAQHGELPHDEHSHSCSPPHDEHQHSEHQPTHGEWSFLLAMLEGDVTGSSPGWYELGTGVSPSPSVAGPGEPGPGSGSAVGMGTLGGALSLPQGMNTLSVPQTVGEADSTLRFALG